MTPKQDDQQPVDQTVPEETSADSPETVADSSDSAEPQPAPAEPAPAEPEPQAPAPESDNGFTDQSLTCRDCGQEFVWTAGEQQFYAEKGFDNPPVRCPNCRKLKKQRRNSDRGPRQSFPITCSNCGKQDTVPFKPSGDRPVYCRDCFSKQ